MFQSPVIGTQPKSSQVHFARSEHRTADPTPPPLTPLSRLPRYPASSADRRSAYNHVQSFLFYWLLAPNVTSFRRNRALRGRIAPFPGAEGNSVAIFRARVASATEEVSTYLHTYLFFVSFALVRSCIYLVPSLFVSSACDMQV